MSPSLDQLKRAVSIKAQIETLEAELASILGGSSDAPAKRKYTKRASADEGESPKAVKKAKRKLSPEGRARLIAAQKARWAKAKGEK